jgi:hypothetical protein
MGFLCDTVHIRKLDASKRQPEPPTTTGDQWLRPSKRLQQVPTTEQRKFRLARSRLKG